MKTPETFRQWLKEREQEFTRQSEQLQTRGVQQSDLSVVQQSMVWRVRAQLCRDALAMYDKFHPTEQEIAHANKNDER